MKSYLFSPLLILIFYSHSFCDNVILRNGKAIDNCIVKDTVGYTIRIIENGNDTVRVPIIDIIGIIYEKYDPNARTLTRTIVDKRIITKKVRPNSKLWPLSIIALGLTFESFYDVSQLNEAIDNYSKLNLKTDELVASRNRKQVLGWTFFIAGLINTIYVLETVEVTATNNSLGISYNF